MKVTFIVKSLILFQGMVDFRLLILLNLLRFRKSSEPFLSFGRLMSGE